MRRNKASRPGIDRVKMSTIAVVAMAVVVLLLVFAFAPAPLPQPGGAALSRSINGSSVEAPECRQAFAPDWICLKWDESRSGGARYVIEVSWLGCWSGYRVRNTEETEAEMPDEISGCLSMLDHTGL